MIESVNQQVVELGIRFCSQHTPRDYGDSRGEYLALRDSVGIIDIGDWTLLTVRGSDRVSFLHGVLTQDVKGLPVHQGNYALFLTPKGKIRSDLWFFHRPEDFVLLTYPELRETLRDGLNRYLITEDVKIEDRTGEKTILAVSGPRSQEIMDRVFGEASIPPVDYRMSEIHETEYGFEVFRMHLFGDTGFILIGPLESGENLWQRLVEAEATPVGLSAMNAIQIERGIPRCGQDLDDSVIPQEAALHRALHFHKGCYLGQEVVARLHFRGHTNRELTRFLIEADRMPLIPLSLWWEGKEVGAITSVAYAYALERWVGLGILRHECRREGEKIVAREEEKEWPTTVQYTTFIGT